jgi:S-adenosylmethionine hydrolase
MRGVILGIASNTTIVDICHSIAPQDVHSGACVIHDVHDAFPPGTIHVVVVDPGVGTSRRILLASCDDQHYVLPDNGLITYLASRHSPSQVIELTNSDYWRRPISSTFHGRDIMAPVAAHLSLGRAPASFGKPITQFEQLEVPTVQRTATGIHGHVRSIDDFGNIISDISRDQLGTQPFEVRCGGRTIASVVACYGDASDGQLVALVGSNGHLEVAVVGGNAQELLGMEVGDAITVSFLLPKQ